MNSQGSFRRNNVGRLAKGLHVPGRSASYPLNMPRLTLLLLLSCITALSAHAAVIRGTVTEQRTGYILSRADVTLEQVPNIGQPNRTARTRENGQFVFSNVGAGSYLLKVT